MHSTNGTGAPASAPFPSFETLLAARVAARELSRTTPSKMACVFRTGPGFALVGAGFGVRTSRPFYRDTVAIFEDGRELVLLPDQWEAIHEIGDPDTTTTDPPLVGHQDPPLPDRDPTPDF
jgi:hypothetical protein